MQESNMSWFFFSRKTSNPSIFFLQDIILYTGFYGGSKKLHLTNVAVLASLVIFHRQELGVMLECLKTNQVELSTRGLKITRLFFVNNTFDFWSQSKILCQHSSTFVNFFPERRIRGKSSQTFASTTAKVPFLAKC